MARVVAWTAGLLGLLCFSVVSTQAADRVKVRTQTYAISGKTGAELYNSLQSRGPRHGFLSRAIAQTSYKVEWYSEVVETGGTCRLVRAEPTLQITYTYPQPTQAMTRDTRRRWAAFMSGVKRHEQRHGAMARQMVRAAQAAVRGLKMAGDPSCRKTRAEVRRRATAIYATYEARQRAFDAKEHRDGGNIDRMIAALVW